MIGPSKSELLTYIGRGHTRMNDSEASVVPRDERNRRVEELSQPGSIREFLPENAFTRALETTKARTSEQNVSTLQKLRNVILGATENRRVFTRTERIFHAAAALFLVALISSPIMARGSEASDENNPLRDENLRQLGQAAIVLLGNAEDDELAEATALVADANLDGASGGATQNQIEMGGPLPEIFGHIGEITTGANVRLDANPQAQQLWSLPVGNRVIILNEKFDGVIPPGYDWGQPDDARWVQIMNSNDSGRLLPDQPNRGWVYGRFVNVTNELTPDYEMLVSLGTQNAVGGENQGQAEPQPTQEEPVAVPAQTFPTPTFAPDATLVPAPTATEIPPITQLPPQVMENPAEQQATAIAATNAALQQPELQQGTRVADAGGAIFNTEGLSQTKIDAVNALSTQINSLPENQKAFVRNLARSINLATMPEEQVDDAFHTLRTVPEALQGMSGLQFNQQANAVEWTQVDGPHAGETFRWRWRNGEQVKPENGYLGARVTGRVGQGLATEVEFECDQYAIYCLNANQGLARDFPQLANGMFEPVFNQFRGQVQNIPNVGINHLTINVTGPGNQLGLENQVVINSQFSYTRAGDRIILTINPAMNDEFDLAGMDHQIIMAVAIVFDQEAAGLDSPRPDTSIVGGIGTGGFITAFENNIFNQLSVEKRNELFPYGNVTLPLQPSPPTETIEQFILRNSS